MNLPKINITKDQKRIIIISSAGLFVFLFLWVLLYFPSLKKIKSLKSQFISTQQQIQAIEKLLAGPKGRDEALVLLRERQQYLNTKFPQKEEEALRFIPELARKLNIEVISLYPGLKTEFLESGSRVLIDGKMLNYMPITMEVRCYYKDLVKYLSDLEESLPAFITVVSLNLQKENQVIGKIRANLELNLYLLI